MFGYSRNSGISWFRNYGDALHKYENTKDIRGRVKEPMRPLGHRKSVDSYSIVKLENGDILRLKGTEFTHGKTVIDMRVNGHWLGGEPNRLKEKSCFVPLTHGSETQIPDKQPF